jgi:large subunit ribosomal protein L17
MHKRINTTLAKAKALRIYVEPLITKAKEDTTHSRRVVFSYLQDKNAVSELFREISSKVGDRPGGYTRIIKLGNRLGDNADMAMIELVDYNEHMLSEAKSKKAKSTRRRRGAKKKATAETTAPAATTETVEVEKKTEEKVDEKVETPKVEAEAKVEEKKEPKAEAKEEPKAETEAKEDDKKKEE